MMKYLLPVLVFIWSSVIAGDDKSRDLVVYNYGLHDCETFLGVLKKGNDKVIAGYKLWLGGYFSNHNLFLKHYGKEMIYREMDQAIKDVGEICVGNKHMSFFDATTELIENYQNQGAQIESSH